MNPIIQILQSMGINHRVYHHEAVYTVEQASKIGSLPSQSFAAAQIPVIHMKNLFLTDGKDNFYLVCIGAHHRLSIKDFARTYGISKLSFGSAEDMMTQLQVSPGSVSVFGIMYQTNTKLYIDSSIVDQPAIGRHPNDNTMTVVLSYIELLKFLDMTGVKPTVLQDRLFA